MKIYKEILTDSFLDDVKYLKKDKVLLDRMQDKMQEIILNPDYYPKKRYRLIGKSSAHIGSYIILIEVQEDKVIFLKFKHHDFVYDYMFLDMFQQYFWHYDQWFVSVVDIV
jgi:mRNA-degrading endonuclease RelE of RelBE toxin-antitoxin system